MHRGIISLFLFSILFFATNGFSQSDIVITEIMQNPSAVSDSDGEWFEVHNPTGSDIDIDGWTIQDNDIDSHVIANGGPLLVPAGGFLILARNADSATNGGVTVDYEYSGIALANGADELVLLDGSLNEVDRVEWDGGATFPDPNGASMSLIAPNLDNTVGSNWCEASTPFGDGDLGTPGAANDCPQATPQIIITEIMQNPSAVSDSNGEWFEVHNPTGNAIDINGWTIQDNDFDSHVITNGGPLLVPAGGFLILANNADSGTNGGVTVDYEYSGIALANGADELVLLDGTLNEIDRVEWDGGATFPDPTGASMSLIAPNLDNNVGSNWCEASTPFGDGDLGTPGAANDCPQVVPEIVITEIMQNPSAVSDSNGEWFEVHNPTGSPIDINGWTIQDNDFDSHVITNGGPLLVPAGGFLILARNADSGTNGGVAVAYEYSGVFLSNSSDELVLLDGVTNEVDRVEWDNGATFPDPNGASMSLIAPNLDNNVGANWCEASTPFGDGDFGTPGAANDCPPPEIIVTEIMQNPSAVSDGSGEWFEVHNPTASAIDVNGWTIKDNDTDSHVINNGGPLLVPAGGFLVLANNADFATNGGVVIDYEYSGIFLANGSDELVLLDVNLTEVDRVEWDNGATFPDPTGASMSLTSPNLDNNVGSNWCEASTPFGDGDFGTPGAFNDCVIEIFTIQGSGLSSPFADQIVTTRDNVVTALAPNGFFMQTPEARTDSDIETSDGIFVFTGGAPGVNVGDIVDVTGEVVEFFDFTEFSNGPTVTVVDPGGGTVPSPIIFDETRPSPNQPQPDTELERFEGMLVQVTDGAVSGPNQGFGSDPIAEVFIVADDTRAFREPGIEFPGLPGLPVWDGNPEVFELDPDKLGLPNQIIPAGSAFDATGVLGFEFGGYELWPTSLTVDAVTLPQSVRAREDGEFTVSSLNLFRLFDDVDDPSSVDAQGRPRDDQVVSNAEYLRRRAKFADYIVNVLRAPDILAVQEAEKIEVLQDLASDIQLLDSGINYTAFLEEGNDIGTIDVGFLVRGTVQVDSVVQLGKNETFTDPTDGSVDLVHDRPPLLLGGSFITSSGASQIAVIGVHNRSLGGIDDPSDGPRVRQKRLEQAQSIAQKVQDLQNADPDVRLVVTGDFNAFQFTDGFVDVVGQISGDVDADDNLLSGPDLVDPNLTNQVLSLSADEQYSFIFNGSAQVLDHALTTVALNPSVTDFAYGRGNADAAEDLIDDDSTPLRSSDHDGLVMYLDVTPPQIVVDEPAQLWPPNHNFQTFSVSNFVTSVTDGVDETVSIADVFIELVTSDEPENGIGDGNTTDDIVIVDCQTVDLRAERAGPGNGRVYTINLAAEDASGNVGTAAFQVQVPHNQNSTAIDDGPVYEVESGCTAPGSSKEGVAANDATETQTAVPTEFALEQNYPNPFNPETAIRFHLPKETHVKIRIFNSLGQVINTLVDRQYQAGVHSAIWDAKDKNGNRVASGVYLYQIQSEDFTQVKKMILLK